MKEVFSNNFQSSGKRKILTWTILFLYPPCFCFIDQIIFHYAGIQSNLFYLRVIIDFLLSLIFTALFFLIVKRSYKRYGESDEELRKNLRLYQLMLENMDDVAWVLDLKSNRFKYVSPSVIKQRGFTAEETVNQTLEEALTPQSLMLFSVDLREVIESYEKGNNSARTIIKEISQPCKDGSIIETEVLISLVKNNEGKVVELIGVTRDISQRKKIQQKLDESEYWITECQRVGQIGTYIYDLNTNTWECSTTLNEIFGIDDLFEKNIDGLISLVHTDDVVEFKKYLLSKINDKSSFDYEYRIICKNDLREKWVHARGKFVVEGIGNVHKMIGTVQDITEHKRDIYLAQESEQKYRAIIETSLNGFFILDKAGYILEVNDAYCKMSGYSREKLLKMNLCDLEFNTAPNEVLNHLLRISKYGSDKFETRHETKDGMIISMEASLTFSMHDGGIFYCFLYDLTDKNQMLQELVLAKDEAERSNRVKSEFLAQMSHEIRSPMNVTLSFTNYIKDELGDSLAPHLIESFAAVDTSTRRVIRTIDLILNMSEMQLGTYEPTWKSFDMVKEIFNNICSEYEFYARQKGLGLVFNSSIPIAKIYGDSYSVTQIFVNLIDNAIKYSNSGAIRINLFKDEQKNIRVTVEDNGIGMSEEFMSKIFEPFTQETQGYSRRFEGNGLGLALVKRYCDLNNADISVESEKGKGTKFTVVFHRLMKLNVAIN